MRSKELPSQFLETTFDIFDNTESVDDVGSVESSETVRYEDIPAHVSAEKSEVEYDIEGVKHFQTNSGYINRYDSSGNLRIVEGGDIIRDNETGYRYLVLGVQENIPFNSEITIGGHLKLTLDHFADQSTEPINIAHTVTAKARIT